MIRARRIVVYLLLLAGTAAFVLPFAWTALTSIKPSHQILTRPPTLLPQAYTWHDANGSTFDVIRESILPIPGAVVRVVRGPDAGQQQFLPAPALAARRDEIELLYQAQTGWWRISIVPPTANPGTAPRWEIVDPATISAALAPRWENYPEALKRIGGDPGVGEAHEHVAFSRFVTNTLLVCVLGVIGTVFSNAIVAYGFARLRWRGRDTFFALTLATMMVPFPVLMIPLYGVFKALGLIGTLTPLWLPAFFGSAFNIFLMRQFFRTIPEELCEAARIDGCSEWRIFWRVVLPLSKPVLAAAAVFHFLWAWNDFMGPLIFLTRKEDFTLSLALQSFQGQHGGVQWHYLMAATVVVMLPVVALFFFAQKSFVQGIATTGAKN